MHCIKVVFRLCETCPTAACLTATGNQGGAATWRRREQLSGVYEVLGEEGPNAPLEVRRAAEELREAMRNVAGWDPAVQWLGEEEGPVVVEM